MHSLDRLDVDYFVVVEYDQLEDYCDALPHKIDNILIIPERFFEEYDSCDDLGTEKSLGPGPARNFCWWHSMLKGHKRHWVMDDNLDDFFRLNRNMKVPVRSGAIFKASEDFVDRYENVYISGFNYATFCKATDKLNPFQLNTRIYSCLLIQNDIHYRWRGRYNEDTDICLRVLKDGHCTVLFNAFLCGKVTTQRMTGGNSVEFYKNDGTFNKSKMLVNLHPDVAIMKERFNRDHHFVDYKPFKVNKLKFVDGVNIEKGVNNYGMKLIEIEKSDKE